MKLADFAAWTAPIFGFFLGWLLNRKKTSAEVRKMEMESHGRQIENIKALLEVYKRAADDVITTNDLLLSQISEERKIHSMEIEQERKDHSEQMTVMKQRIDELEVQVQHLKDQLSKK